jgi:hypothetical protein
MSQLVCVCFQEGWAGGGARDILTTGRIRREPVETIDKAQYIRHEYVGDGEGSGQPFALCQHRLQVLEPSLEEVVKSLPARRVVSPENANMDQGRLAISTELSAANSHSVTSLRLRGSAGISASLNSPK